MSLLDFLQSASNAAAGNVSGPVDLVSTLLNKLGVPVQNPVGGSEWMKQKGLMRDVPQSPSSLAGETFGLLSPIGVAAKAPQIAAAALKAQQNAAIPRQMNPQMGAIVYHGSPHKFDKFDSSKIGSGEGSQAYGHGLYVAESPDVARSYQAMANSPARRQGGLTSIGQDQAVLDSLIKLNARKFADGDVEKFAEVLRSRPSAFSKPDEMLARIAEYKDNLAPSYMYKVDLPDTAIAKMLDWDKPLSQQAPEVAGGIERAMQARGFSEQQIASMRASDPSGEKLHAFLGGIKGQQTGADVMRKAGIPGIRYLDGGSRGAGSGTSNYVVFPGAEDLLKILERNGVAP
jgi:hypothetical protein